MKARRTLSALPIVLATTALCSLAQAAELRAVAPPGGGQDALSVALDLGAGVVRAHRCKTADCSDQATATKTIAVLLDTSRVDPAAASVQVLSIGEGKSVVHVRVPDRERKDLAFEALLSAGVSEPIFAGLTGLAQNEQGDGAGHAVLIYDKNETDKFVLVADVREDTRICGQSATPLAARGLDPKSMQLRGATMHRLDKKARDAATPIVAEVRKDGAQPPLGRLLVATGGSSPGAATLTDGDASSVFREDRPGDGHGEFATLRAPSEVPLVGVTMSVAPPKPDAGFAAPKTFYLATDDRLFRVTMPEDAARKPAGSYEVNFAEPVRTTCLAIVFDEAYGRGRTAFDVGIAELAAKTKFDADGATLEDVAAALGTNRAGEAAAILRRAGEPGLAAVVPKFDALDASARALAIDVAASAGTCEGPAMQLVGRALADKDMEVRRRALGRVERCGKAAAGALVDVVRGGSEAERTAAAPLLAAVSPSQALAPLAAELGKGAPSTRRALRSALARAASSQSREKLSPLLTREEASDDAKLETLRALGPRLAELRPEADAVVADLLRSSNDLRTRYLLAAPLAHLSRSSAATEGELSRLAAFVQKDPDWQVRAQAVSVSGGIPELLPSVLVAANDPEPRVREAAMKALGSAGAKVGRDALRAGLAGDPWTFVRIAAAEALGSLPTDAASERSLVDALDEPRAKVRIAALAALGRLRATSAASRIEKLLDDDDQNPDVRIAAARTLGAMCVHHALDSLTKLTALSLSPVSEYEDRLGMAAIEALGAIHPDDLTKRLSPLREKNVRTPVRFAADRAASEPSSCQRR